jgi:D-glycero-alpha-D-manno-heptose-7-phosphate kinase
MPHSKIDLPLRTINSVAPIRICDNGGWTDTWFAGQGTIFNIGVYPCVEVQVAIYLPSARANRIVLNAENYGERYAIVPGRPGYIHHPLLEAAVAELPPPEDIAIEISIHSEVPAGCSTGTSAAVCVALLGALDMLTSGRMSQHQIAYRAHRVEVERLGLQSGIQDQLCAAYGALNFIEMFEKEFFALLPQVRMSSEPSTPDPCVLPLPEGSSGL